MNTQPIITLLGLLTLVSIIALIMGGAALLLKKKKLLQSNLNQHLSKLLFLIPLVATSGSLFLSEVAEFKECELCWLQRIFMYPLAILFGLAWHWSEQIIFKYAAPLVAIGWCIALYHTYISSVGTQSAVCGVDSQVSCTTTYFTEFGFITIPVMSLTAFSLIGFLLFIARDGKTK